MERIYTNKNTMKILYDHLCFSEKYGGVSKYFTKMIHNLPVEVQYDVAVKYTNNEYIKELSLIGVKRIIENISFIGKMRIFSLINKPYSIRKIKQSDYDIYHQTHYNPYGYKYLPINKVSVTSIYDMNFFMIPEAYKGYKYTKSLINWQKYSANKADKIIAISENTKKDIINIWNFPEKKIKVIYLGIENFELDNYNKKRLISKPYILFVGQRSYQKNFNSFLKTFKIISQKTHDLLLVCTGNPFSRKEKQIIYQMGLAEKIIQISADEKKMVNLYYNAELFVYPSLYEGFGMPILEAMSCHCPVICSGNSCFPEIAGDAALYFDPYNIESMTETTRKLLDDSGIKKKLVESGIKRIKYFSWEKCAKEHRDTYLSLL
jgi:glycosyltransferase involved in cell wall biosynthesis